ncbi:MAG: protein kinase [Catenulispora sp.]|nr:protein kinase [Catenulispora sp.]
MPADPSSVFDDLGTALGVTELVPLAQGGQKFVLRALRQGRPVAVKAMLVPPGPLYAAALERARRETRVLAAVDSPRLVRLLGEMRELRYQGVVPYGLAWTEELLDGSDLEELLGSPWRPAEAARLLVHLAEALAALHAEGIVHRDLNPGNVRRRADGGYCLMDPGLARFLTDEDPADAHCIGTVGYLSPEHVPGGAVGPPSDVYCLGILIHQALTAELPTAPDAAPPPETPAALTRIIDRCLRLKPAERFADGGELLAELARHPDLRESAFDDDSAPDDPPTALEDLGYARCGEEVVEVRGAFGTRRVEVESLAKDQEPFAVRLQPCELEIASGVTFAARTVELGDGRFTNLYELAVDTRRARVGVTGGGEGFHLPHLLAEPAVIAAVSGSFSFISDDADYEPAEFCLDFCARDGMTVSLPTVGKPAFTVGRDGLRLAELDARGTLRIGDRRHDWIGSKVRASPADASSLVVYGAANCRVRYSEAERVALLRGVDRAANRTPAGGGDVVDLVVARRDTGHVVTAVHRGGGVDLFEGSFVLRGRTGTVGGVRPGDEVEIRSVGGVAAAGIESGFSVGPSVAAAARADRLEGYDESLGLSPFLPGARYARTLICLTGDLLRLRVLDGAPLTRGFQGLSCSETARLVQADGLDPEAVYHLDGGQSAKLAFRRRDGAEVVLGSMHYLLWPKQDAGAFHWQGREGRLLRSALAVRVDG